MARRRFQRGSLRKRVGKTKTVWVAQWREDTIEDGVVLRKFHKEVLGTAADFPTRKLAQRELDRRLGEINSPDYRPKPNITFRELVEKYKCLLMIGLKPSTQSSMRSHFRTHLAPVNNCSLKDFSTEMLQRLVNSWTISAKSTRNLVMTLRTLWRSAKSWHYVTGNPFDGLMLPRRERPQTFAFSLGEVRRILQACDIQESERPQQPGHTNQPAPKLIPCTSPSPLKLFLWLAAETGFRAGELCGITLDDIDFHTCQVRVRQSVWRGKLQQPKTAAGTRSVTLSEQLCGSLRGYIDNWRPNSTRLLFATRNGTPWDANLLVKRKLHPLLRSLGIRVAGLHAFRHTNASLMNQLNVDVKTRQARLGHANAATTLDVYTHAEPEADRRVAEQLGEMLSSNADILESQRTATAWQQPGGNA